MRAWLAYANTTKTDGYRFIEHISGLAKHDACKCQHTKKNEQVEWDAVHHSFSLTELVLSPILVVLSRLSSNFITV